MSCLWVCTGFTQRKETNAIVCIVSISFVSIVSLDFEERRQVKWSPLRVLAIPPRRWRVRTIRQKYPSCVSCSLINPAAFALASGGSGHEPDVTFRDQLPLTRNARVITWPTMLCWCRANERWGLRISLAPVSELLWTKKERDCAQSNHHRAFN